MLRETLTFGSKLGLMKKFIKAIPNLMSNFHGIFKSIHFSD